MSEASQALFRLGRLFSKYPLREQVIGADGNATELSRILVAEALAAGAAWAGQELTIGVVAERLAIDPSTASRLVAEAIADGYVLRVPSHTDNRRIRLELTASGKHLVTDAHRYQRAIFEQVTHDWSPEEVAIFARLLVQFVDAVADLRTKIAGSGESSMA